MTVAIDQGQRQMLRERIEQDRLLAEEEAKSRREDQLAQYLYPLCLFLLLLILPLLALSQ